jgi:peptide/nickel transport system substrate-binding protein
LMADFKAGNHDIMITHQVQDVQTLDQTGKYSIVGLDVNTIFGLEGDSKHADSPWANIKVRQAAQYAIDSATLVKAIGYGYWQTTNQFDIPSRWGYNPNVVGYPYNVAKAKQLMSEAGYANGFETIIYGMDQYATQMAALQGYLKEIGINAKAQVVTPEKRVQMFSSGGWNGVWIWECTVQPSTLVNMGRNFTATAAPTRMISVDVPAAFSALVSQAVAETDPAKQKQLTWQAEKDMIDTYAFITLYGAGFYPIVTVKKFHDLQLNTTLHYSPSDWWLEK